MLETVKIVTKVDWPSFGYTALTIRNALKSQCKPRIYDWATIKPGGKIIFIGTVDQPTLRFAIRLMPKSDMVFYGTTEGISRIDNKILLLAKKLRIVAVSNFVKQMLEPVGLPAAGVLHHGIDMISNSIDTEFHQKIRSRIDSQNVVLAVSANHVRKGLDRLLEAWKIVEGKVPNSTLVLHSQPNGYYDLEKKAGSLNLKRLWLTRKFGKIRRFELNSLYKLSDIYVQPSYSEGFGLPILEAFRFNKPVVAVNSPPFNEIIDHESTGLLVPPQTVSWKNFEKIIDLRLQIYSANDLAVGVIRLLQNQELRAHISETIEARKWNWDAERLYPKLLTYFN